MPVKSVASNNDQPTCWLVLQEHDQPLTTLVEAYTRDYDHPMPGILTTSMGSLMFIALDGDDENYLRKYYFKDIRKYRVLQTPLTVTLENEYV